MSQTDVNQESKLYTIPVLNSEEHVRPVLDLYEQIAERLLLPINNSIEKAMELLDYKSILTLDSYFKLISFEKTNTIKENLLKSLYDRYKEAIENMAFILTYTNEKDYINVPVELKDYLGDKTRIINAMSVIVQYQIPVKLFSDFIENDHDKYRHAALNRLELKHNGYYSNKFKKILGLVISLHPLIRFCIDKELVFNTVADNLNELLIVPNDFDEVIKVAESYFPEINKPEDYSEILDFIVNVLYEMLRTFCYFFINYHEFPLSLGYPDINDRMR